MQSRRLGSMQQSLKLALPTWSQISRFSLCNLINPCSVARPSPSSAVRLGPSLVSARLAPRPAPAALEHPFFGGNISSSELIVFLVN